MKFEKGFKKDDVILKETDRYVEVQNGYQKFIVGDNGERRLFWISFQEMQFEDKITTGPLSLKELKDGKNI
jgi:hypothetical protein